MVRIHSSHSGMFCTSQIGQVMLSLPRANYLTSAAAGLPLMIVRFLCTFAVHFGNGKTIRN